MSLAASAEELEPEVTFIMNGHLAVPVRLSAKGESGRVPGHTAR
jgi:hypothetical protein